MTYQSLHFLLFAVIVLLLYYIVGQKRQKYVLLLANLYFFWVTGIEHIPVILISMICSFLAGRKISAVYTEADEQLKAAETPAQKKQIRADSKAAAKKILMPAMVVVLGLLVGYKAAALILKGSEIKVSLPLGISYYTFMAISYMLDIYWRKAKAELSFVSYAVFLSYFPHIVQGPIDRYKAVGPQINQGAKLNYKNITFGAQLAMWGFFKKMVIADRLSVIFNQVIPNYQNYSGSILLLVCIFSTIELYCNFSGCTDMIRGISQMMGIEIGKNFDNPFFAKSAPEFWRRWHMSLGSWFKDYVYMPLSSSPRVIKLAIQTKQRFGPRVGKTIAMAVPTAITWLLTGLWHGTGWNYILWGVYWGTIIICSNTFAPEFDKLSKLLRINTETDSWQLVRMIRTFTLFMVGKILTSINDLETSFGIMKRIFCNFNIGALFDRSVYNLGLDRSNFQLAMVLLVFLWCMELLQSKGSVRERVAGYNIVFRWILYYALFFAIIIFGMYGPGYEASAFVYGNY